MKKVTVILLACIVFLAFVLRIYKVGQVPLSPYWEEAAIGYDAYSILKTGKDHHGNPYPILAFPSFGDYKPSLYFYTVVPFIWMRGLDTIAVRLPSVFAGTLTVIVVYLIGKKLYSKQVGLIAAFLFAIQPWSIQLSRVGFETNVATLLVSLGVLFGLYAKKKPVYLLLCSMFLGLSMYTYHAERIVAPILGILLVAHVLWKSVLKKTLLYVVISGVLAIGIALPIIMNMKNPVVVQRAQETSIFSDVSVIEQSNALKEKAGNTVLSKLVYHRYVLFSEIILRNAVKNFSPSFLFLSGDDNLRHSTQELGLLYHWEIIPILVAFVVVIKKRSFVYLLPIIWMGVSSLAPAVTTVSPHALRFFSAAPTFSLLSAIGIMYLATQFKKYKVIVLPLFIGVVVLEMGYYLHFYFTHYAIQSAAVWQYGYSQLYETLAEEKKEHEHVFVTREQGRPAMYYAFYQKLDPAYIQHESEVEPKDQLELLRIGEYSFVDALPKDSGLYATSPKLYDGTSQLVKQITLPTGEVVWDIWRKP